MCNLFWYYTCYLEEALLLLWWPHLQQTTDNEELAPRNSRSKHVIQERTHTHNQQTNTAPIAFATSNCSTLLRCPPPPADMLFVIRLCCCCCVMPVTVPTALRLFSAASLMFGLCVYVRTAPGRCFVPRSYFKYTSLEFGQLIEWSIRLLASCVILRPHVPT